jgi:serine phosphatase RsbU (regulator of sigma subunit)
MEQLNTNINTEVNAIFSEAVRITYSREINDKLADYSNPNNPDKWKIRLELQSSISKSNLAQFTTLKKGYLDSNFDMIAYSSHCEISKQELIVMSEKSKETDAKPIWGVATVDGTKQLIMLRPIKWFYEDKIIGYFFVVLNEEHLKKFYEIVDIGESSDILLINKSKTILSSRNIEYPVGSTFEYFDDTEDGKMLLNYKTVNIKDKEYLIVNVPLGDWYTISIIPMAYIVKDSLELGIYSVILGTICLVLSIVFSLKVSNKIAKPLKLLISDMEQVKEGILVADVTLGEHELNEISLVVNNFKHMVNNIKLLYNHLKQQIEEQTKQLKETETEEFVNEISAEKVFDFNHIIKMNKALDVKISEKSKELKDKNENIMASIRCASMIQLSILPREELLAKFFKEHFIYWKPRDVVGGDFYWFEQIGENYLIAVIDCTGHGVPGALMTMSASSVLNRIAAESSNMYPADILKNLNKYLKIVLNHHLEMSETESTSAYFDAGLDIGLCLINPRERKLIYSGAKIGLLVCKNSELLTIKGDKQGIGYKTSNNEFDFTNHVIEFDGDEMFYLTTDGYIDQLGGVKSFSFGMKRFKETILENHQKSMEEQKKVLESTIMLYRGNTPQTDDIAVLGFKLY